MVPRASELVGARGFLVVAEVVPVATSSLNGLLSANQYKWLFPITDKIGTSDKLMVVKSEMSGKLSFLCGFMGNYNSAGMLYISLSRSYTVSTFARWIAKQSYIKFFYKWDGNQNFELYVSGLGSWAECAFIRLTGAINSVTVVSAVPEDAIQIQVGD